jgi:hypothetical protein
MIIKEEEAYFSPGFEIDVREARAIYCRCVYETTGGDKRLDEFVAALEIDVFSPYDQDGFNEDYPILQDIVDAKPGEMQDLEAFLPAWKKALSQRGTNTRSAVLLLEAVHRLEGTSGVSMKSKCTMEPLEEISKSKLIKYKVKFSKRENRSQTFPKVKNTTPMQKKYFNMIGIKNPMSLEKFIW